MRQKVIAVLALSSFISFLFQVKGQDKDPSDKTWPSLGSAEQAVDNELAPLYD